MNGLTTANQLQYSSSRLRLIYLRIHSRFYDPHSLGADNPIHPAYFGGQHFGGGNFGKAITVYCVGINYPG